MRPDQSGGVWGAGGGTVRGSIKSNLMLRGDMDHDVRTGGRNKQLVFFAVVIFFLKSFVSIVNREKGQINWFAFVFKLYWLQLYST